MKKILILLFFLSENVLAQKLPSTGFDKIRIAEPNRTIQADLKPVTSNPEMEPDRLYYWYSGNSIHTTQGGYSGRLLNGVYLEYYLNKNLKEMGAFKKGLKDDIWKSWNENGILTQFHTWKNGVKSGEFNLFDDAGKLKQSGTYKNDLLEGKAKSYDKDNKLTMISYHKGVIVPVKSPSSILKKVNIFKKKDKQPTVTKPK